MPTGSRQIAHYADWADHSAGIHAAISDYGRRHAEQAHPEHHRLHAAAEAAAAAHQQAWREFSDTSRLHRDQLAHYGVYGSSTQPEQQLENTEQHITATETRLAAAQSRLGQLRNEPAIRAQPADFLNREHRSWQAGHDADHSALLLAGSRDTGVDADAAHRMHEHEQHMHHHGPDRDHGPSIGR